MGTYIEVVVYDERPRKLWRRRDRIKLLVRRIPLTADVVTYETAPGRSVLLPFEDASSVGMRWHGFSFVNFLRSYP